MKHLTLLIKPVSGLCNLRCKYCFYRDLKKEDTQMQKMTPEVMHQLISRALAEAEQTVTFLFQGGEPTLAGLDFFRSFTEAVVVKKPKGLQVSYGIQTNGLLLDAEWAAFLKEHGFLVGLSLDGDAGAHDLNRVDAAGRGSYRQVMAAKRLMDEAGTQYNVLCVVTAATARHARQLYTWFRRQGLCYLQFIACLDPIAAERGTEKYSLTPERYGRFLCELFDLWYADWTRGSYVSIRLFDDYVHMLAGMGTSTCASSGHCGSYLVVEHDGGCYPCDFYVTPEWYLGNLMEAPLAALQNSARALDFRKEYPPRDECGDCPYLFVCRGGCKRDCQTGASLGGNYFCTSFRTFFEHALPKLQEIASAERRAHRKEEQICSG